MSFVYLSDDARTFLAGPVEGGASLSEIELIQGIKSASDAGVFMNIMRDVRAEYNRKGRYDPVSVETACFDLNCAFEDVHKDITRIRNTFSADCEQLSQSFDDLGIS